MAKSKIVKTTRAVCNGIMGFGRWIGARRFLFVWSAVAVAITLFIGIAESVELYNANFVLDLDIFVLTRLLDMLFIFLKLFIPMFMLVMAAKYIFDCNGRHSGRASETFRLSFAAALFVGLMIGIFYYLNAGHIIGENTSACCPNDAVCWFNWDMLKVAGKAFLASSIGMFITFLAVRGIYAELSFMLSKNKI